MYCVVCKGWDFDVVYELQHFIKCINDNDRKFIIKESIEIAI